MYFCMKTDGTVVVLFSDLAHPRATDSSFAAALRLASALLVCVRKMTFVVLCPRWTNNCFNTAPQRKPRITTPQFSHVRIVERDSCRTTIVRSKMITGFQQLYGGFWNTRQVCNMVCATAQECAS